VRGRRPLAAALGLVLAASAAAFFLPLPEEPRLAALNGVLVALCLVAATAAAVAARAPENREARTAFLFLAAGAAAWGIGQATWTYYEVVVGAVPDASLADAGFLAALPLFAAGVLTWPRRRTRAAAGSAVDAALLTGIVFLCSFVFVLRPVLDEPLTPLLLLAIAYPLGDVVLLAAVLFGIAAGAFGHSGRILVLAPGFFAFVVADTYYASASDYVTGASVLDFGWTLGLAAVALCALMPPSWGAGLRVPRTAAPLVATALLLAAAVGMVQGPDWHSIETVPTALVVALFVLLIVRHVAVANGLQRQARALRKLQRDLEREHDVRDAALNASRTGACILGEDGTLVFRNEAWRTLLAFVESDDAAIRSLVGRLTVDAEHRRERTALRFWTPGGRYLAVASSPLPDGATLLTVDDLTDQEQERATRNRFLAEVVGAQDYEARRVAELLHDDVVQRLTALGLRLELAASRGRDDSLVTLAREAGEITGAIRRLLVELHPAVLESQGLSAAIDAAAGSLRALGVEVVVGDLESRLPQELEQLAYRLVQEAFANALKHAKATRVDVRLAISDGTLTCEVVDDGAGFDPSEATAAVRRGSLGLQLVRERVAMVRGGFQLESAPGRGTCFRFELPLPSESAPRARETSGAAA